MKQMIVEGKKDGCNGCFYDDKEENKEKDKFIYGKMLLERLNEEFIKKNF